jgi:predicted acyltransferase
MTTIAAETKSARTSESVPSTTQRFPSLDIFRGMTIAGMILVNTPGSWSYVYSPLRHAPWNGCTPTDLVFPFFLFAVGNAMSFSIGKYQALGNVPALRKIFTRAALIFAIGLFLNWFPFVRWEEGTLVAKQWENLRIFGVLQRIALAYLGGALIAHFYKPTQAFFIAAFLLVAYWIILLMYGDLTLEGNAVLKLDGWLVGDNHLYKGYFSSVANANIPFDPEGLLSTIPAIASVIFGFLVGRFIQHKGNSFEMISHLFVVGLVSIFVGLWWGILFPINKPIWSSSYVLYTTGLAMVILAMIIFIVDLRKRDGWSKPFILYGKNPLLIFALSGIIVKIYSLIRIDGVNAYAWLYNSVFQPIGGDYFGSFLFAIAHVLLFLAIAAWLDKRKIYFRV